MEPAAPWWRTHGAVTRRRLVAVLAVAAVVAVVAGPVLGSGQPVRSTSDADRAAADAAAAPADEAAMLDGLAAARDADGLAPVDHHPEPARLARDWAQVMADAEELDELATCADLDDPAPGPVWHPQDPHLDLATIYRGDIGEVVGCFADEVDAEAFLANRLADLEHAGELLEPTWRHVGVGAVTAPSGATFAAVVLMDGTAASPDRRGIAQLLAATGDRVAGGDDALLLAGSGAVTDLLRAAPLAGGAAAVLATDRATAAESDPVLTGRVRHRIDQLTAGTGRVLVVGGEDVLSARAAAELEAVGYDVPRVVATHFGADPSSPVRMPSDVSDGPHAPAIGALTEARVLIGRSDGRFVPSGTLTRAQLATVLARSLDLFPVGDQPFDDATGSVHADAIAAAAAAGIVEGFEDGTFRPRQPVTRGQLASMIARAHGLTAPAELPPHPDIAGSVHTDAIAAVIDAGIVRGFADGTFRPQATATRAQTATFVLNSLLFG